MTSGSANVHDDTVREARARRVLGRDALLVASVLTPPSAWAFALSLDFALVYPAARIGNKAPLWVVSVGSAILAALAAAVAVSVLRNAERAGQSPDEMARIRSLAIAACALSAFFVLAIAALAVPVAGLELP